MRRRTFLEGITASALYYKIWRRSTNGRLKQAREYLKLSREFVAGQMGLPYDEIRAIEDRRREVNAEEFDLQE